MRLFEATGVGALLLTEAGPNLAELFAPGREVVAYDGTDDLVEKVDALPRRRRATASRSRRAGQARTLAEHTYRRSRSRELAEILEATAARSA